MEQDICRNCGKLIYHTRLRSVYAWQHIHPDESKIVGKRGILCNLGAWDSETPIETNPNLYAIPMDSFAKAVYYADESED